jgi:peptidoglycan/xylan/chitin deacetylase (PgdA/CDA1 family)
MLTGLLKSFLIYAGPFSVVRALQRIKKGPCISILYGHRVLPDEVIANQEDSRTITGQTSVSEVWFAIQELRKFYTIISMDEAVAQIQKGEIKTDSVVLTFDDGFQDNFTHLYPLLKKHKIPATYYVNSSVISTKNSLWFQSIINYFFAIQETSVFVSFSNTTYDLSTATKRYESAFHFMRYLQANYKPEEFHSIIESVAGELRFPNEDDLHMTWEDLKELSKDPLITIGAHSYNHYPLGFCDDKLSTYEINQSINELENHLGYKIVHFSYPRGHQEDFNQHHIDCLKSKKIISAVSTIRGVNRKGEDLHRLRRVGLPQNVSKAKADFLWHVGGLPELIKSLKSKRAN